MRIRNVIIVLLLGIIALLVASLFATQLAQAQCDPATGACPPPSSGGGGGKKRPTAIPPTFTPTYTSTPTLTPEPTATQPSGVLMPIFGGGGSPQSPPTPTYTATLDPKIVAMIETAACATTFAATPQSKFLYLCWSPTPTPCVLCPLPNVPPTIVAGPVFLRPGVINVIIIVALIALLAGLIIIVRGPRSLSRNRPPNPNDQK